MKSSSLLRLCVLLLVVLTSSLRIAKEVLAEIPANKPRTIVLLIFSVETTKAGHVLRRQTPVFVRPYDRTGKEREVVAGDVQEP